MISPREDMARLISVFINRGYIEASYDGNILYLSKPHIKGEKDKILAIDMENRIARGATYQLSQHSLDWIKDHLKNMLAGVIK